MSLVYLSQKEKIHCEICNESEEVYAYTAIVVFECKGCKRKIAILFQINLCESCANSINVKYRGTSIEKIHSILSKLGVDDVIDLGG